MFEFFCGKTDLNKERVPLIIFFSNELLKLIKENKMRCFLIGMKFTRPDIEKKKGK